LGGQEELIPAPDQPGRDPQLGVAVGGGRVDVVDAELQQDGEDGVSPILLHARQAGGPEDGAGAAMPGPPELHLLDHLHDGRADVRWSSPISPSCLWRPAAAIWTKWRWWRPGPFITTPSSSSSNRGGCGGREGWRCSSGRRSGPWGLPVR